MWLKVDDGMLDHPKWRRAVKAGGCATVHLWLALGTWCARHLTDGRIPADMVSEVGGPRGKRTRERALRVLAECQLTVSHVSGDVLLNDYLDYNPSRDDVHAERERKARNKQDCRLRKNVTGSGTGAEPAGNHVPSRTRPVPVPYPSLEDPPVGPPRGTPTKRTVQMPTEFAPDAGHRSLALELGVSLQEEFAKFHDHHLAKGSRFVRWDLALRTWLRNAKTYSRGRQGPANGHSRGLDMTRVGEQVRELERREAEEERRKGAKE